MESNRRAISSARRLVDLSRALAAAGRAPEARAVLDSARALLDLDPESMEFEATVQLLGEVAIGLAYSGRADAAREIAEAVIDHGGSPHLLARIEVVAAARPAEW